MVGHTHEDIDQSFSCLSRYLRKHDALTMPGKTVFIFYTVKIYFISNYVEMEEALKSSNQNVKNSCTLNYVYDIKNWIAPYLDEIHGHTTPHVFRFRLNNNKRAEMHYQHWSHEPWKPSGNGHVLLKVFEP